MDAQTGNLEAYARANGDARVRFGLGLHPECRLTVGNLAYVALSDEFRDEISGILQVKCKHLVLNAGLDGDIAGDTHAELERYYYPGVYRQIGESQGHGGYLEVVFLVQQVVAHVGQFQSRFLLGKVFSALQLKSGHHAHLHHAEKHYLTTVYEHTVLGVIIRLVLDVEPYRHLIDQLGGVFRRILFVEHPVEGSVSVAMGEIKDAVGRRNVHRLGLGGICACYDGGYLDVLLLYGAEVH